MRPANTGLPLSVPLRSHFSAFIVFPLPYFLFLIPYFHLLYFLSLFLCVYCIPLPYSLFLISHSLFSQSLSEINIAKSPPSLTFAPRENPGFFMPGNFQ